MTLEDQKIISAYEARRRDLMKMVESARKAASGIFIRDGKVVGRSAQWKEKLTRMEAAKRILEDIK